MATSELGLKNDFSQEVIPDSWLNLVADSIEWVGAGFASIDISGSGDTTLTAAQYKTRLIVLTGALTGNRNVILPARKFRWVIYNNTSGAYTVTAKTAAGAGVAVTQGKRALVYGDGTDVLPAVTDLVAMGISSFAATLLDDVTAAAARVTLQLAEQSHANQAAVTLGNTNGEIAGLTFSAAPTQAECEALRDKCEELADDVRALSVLLHQLRTDLIALDLIKGSA